MSESLLLLCAKFIIVGAFWGCTNPFIKKGTQEERALRHDKRKEKKGIISKSMDCLKVLTSLASIKAAIPYLINQSGSAVYYYLLGSEDISLAVPICNSMTFVFTAFTSFVLGEKLEYPVKCLAGVLLVIFGTVLCVLSKQIEQKEDM
mmetsp:Transcript_28402/g.37143  ORF Transcript_28402/g.37143 Transcript_28402/m.37143 type:complete len:148 (-) Transcript_28402:122-565(-)